MKKNMIAILLSLIITGFGIAFPTIAAAMELTEEELEEMPGDGCSVENGTLTLFEGVETLGGYFGEPDPDNYRGIADSQRWKRSVRLRYRNMLSPNPRVSCCLHPSGSIKKAETALCLCRFTVDKTQTSDKSNRSAPCPSPPAGEYQADHLPSRPRQVHGTLDGRCPAWSWAVKAVNEQFAHY